MYYVYILTNKSKSAMYIGITNDLQRRIYEHRSELIDGFSKRYHTSQLVYFEEYSNVNQAINREKQLKSWSRAKKNDLVYKMNPTLEDLFEKRYEKNID